MSGTVPVQAQLLPLVSPTHFCEDFAPAYPRPYAKKYLPQPAQCLIYWRPQMSQKSPCSPETASGSLLLMPPPNPFLKDPSLGRPSFSSRELNSATHQTDTRPLNPPIPPHRPLLHNHFRFRDGHTYSHIVYPPFPAPPGKRGGGGAESLQRAGCSGARLTRRRRLRRRHSAGGAALAGRGGSRVGWEDPEGANGGRIRGGARGHAL